MTNIDPANDGAIAAFEAAAEAIAGLRPEVVGALGRAAAAGGSSEEISQRIRQASGKIIEALTEVAAAAAAPAQPEPKSDGEAAYQEAGRVRQPATPAMMAARRSSPPAEALERAENQYTGNDVSFSAEEVNIMLAAYFAKTGGGEIRIPGIIREAFGDARVDRETYRLIWNRVEQQPSAHRTGRARFFIDAGPEWEGSPNGHQLPLWNLLSPPVDEPESPMINAPVADTDVGTVPDEAPADMPAEITAVDGEAPESTGETATEVVDLETGNDQEDSETISDEELIGMVARFMGRRPYFTGNDLREHLLKNEAVSPEEIAGSKIHAFIEEFMMYVDEYYFDKGDQVIWTDSSIDPAAVRQAMGGRMPRVKTYVLGFRPRPVVPVESRPAVKRTAAKAGVPVPEAAAPETPSSSAGETEGQHERAITADQIRIVVDIVESVGDALRWDSLLEILTDPEELNISREEAAEWINAAISDGKLFRKGIAGHKGVSRIPKEKQKAEPQAVDTHSIEYIEREVDKYARVVDYVMNSLTGLKELTMGLRYDRLWRRAGMQDDMTFEEFKDMVRRMEDDGFVSIPTNAKLSSGKSRSQIIRGSKVMFPNPEVRRQWKTYRGRMLNEAKEKALNRFIN